MNKKNTLIGIFIIIALLAGAFVVYQFVFDTIEQKQDIIQTMEISEQEKLINQQIAELDALRKQFLEKQTAEQSAVSAQDQTKSIDILRDRTIKQTAIQTQKTASEQLEELDALRLSAQADAQSIQN